MAIEKAKIEQAALKYIQRGQLRKAIAEYQKITAADPKDLRIRIKLLDLYSKESLKSEAVEECRRITSFYVEQGFILRAIAVWKQAVKVDPENPEIYENIGELYLKQQLAGDALAMFRKAAEYHRKKERYLEAGKILGRMESLAPDNVEVKVQLAELHLSTRDEAAFYRQLDKVIHQLKKEGRARKLLTILEALYERSGKRKEIVPALAETCLVLGEDEKAVQFLRQGLSEEPQDTALRMLQVRANVAMGNYTDARKVALALSEEFPQDLALLEQLAAIAKARGETEELAHWYKELAKAYSASGDGVKERYYYALVLEFMPDDAEALLFSDGLETAASTFFGRQKTAPSEEQDIFSGEGIIVNFDDFGSFAEEEREAEVQDEGVLEADLYLKYGLEEKALAKLADVLAVSPGNLKARAKYRDLCWKRGDEDGWLREQLTIARLNRDLGRPGEALRAYEAAHDFAPKNEEALLAIAELSQSSAATFFEPEAPVSELALVDDELLEADKLISLGETGEAVSILLRLQESHPEDLEIATRLADLGWMTSSGSAAEADDAFAEIKAELGDIEFDMASSIAGFEDVEVSELDDILKEFKSGVAEKLDEDDFDTHFNLGMAYREMGLFDDAITEFRKAAAFEEKAKSALTSMAMVYRENGQFLEARNALDQALALSSNTRQDRVSILFELGTLAEEAGDWPGALNAYEKAFQIEPGHRDISERLSRARAFL